MARRIGRADQPPQAPYAWARTRLDGRQGTAIWWRSRVFAYNLVKIATLAGEHSPAQAQTRHPATPDSPILSPGRFQVEADNKPSGCGPSRPWPRVSASREY